MESAMVVDRGARLSSDTPIRMSNVPLTFFHSGDSAKLVKVRGTQEVRHHLENLGFVEGADLEIVSMQAGNLIVGVKGTQVALDRSIASKILACA